MLFVFAFAAVQPVFSLSLEELTGHDRAQMLKTADIPITRVQQKNSAPLLMPRYGELEILINEIRRDLEPGTLVETLYLYKKPGLPGRTVWDSEEQTGLFNQITALSTLAGIQYYSESRKAMRIFYESSQITDGPSGSKALPDTVYNALPVTLTLYARQKDLTFGENIYRYDYRTGSDYIFFVQENLTSMNAGIIPAVGKNKFRTVFAIIDTGDSLLIYAAAMAKTVSIPGMADRIGSSFTNRALAVLGWFTDRADTIFR